MAREGEQFARRVLQLSTPEKLRFAAALLEVTNDIKAAVAVIQWALDELSFTERIGPWQSNPKT